MDTVFRGRRTSKLRPRRGAAGRSTERPACGVRGLLLDDMHRGDHRVALSDVVRGRGVSFLWE